MSWVRFAYCFLFASYTLQSEALQCMRFKENDKKGRGKVHCV